MGKKFYSTLYFQIKKKIHHWVRLEQELKAETGAEGKQEDQY